MLGAEWPELADELLEDWNLKVTAAGIENLGMAPLPPPPIDFLPPSGVGSAQQEGS